MIPFFLNIIGHYQMSDNGKFKLMVIYSQDILLLIDLLANYVASCSNSKHDQAFRWLGKKIVDINHQQTYRLRKNSILALK